MIIRGTTPTHRFFIPFPISNISQIEVSYSQCGEIILTKYLNDLEIDSENNLIYVNLSQDDTLAFHFNEKNRDNLILIDIRVLLVNGKAYASDTIKERLRDVLRDGKIMPAIFEEGEK